MKWQNSIQARPANKRLAPEDQSFTAFQAAQKRNSNSLLVLNSVRVKEPSLHRSTARSKSRNQTDGNQSRVVNTGQGKTEEEVSERGQQSQEDIRNTTKARYLKQLNLRQSHRVNEHLHSQIEQLKSAIDVVVLAFKQKCNYQDFETETMNEVSDMIGTHVIGSLRDTLPSPTLDKIMKKISEKVDSSPKITKQEEHKTDRVLSYKQSKIEERERLNNIKKSYDKIRLILGNENHAKQAGEVAVKEKKPFQRTNGARKQKTMLPRKSEDSEINGKLSSSSLSRVCVQIQESFYEISKVLHSVSGNS